MIRLSPITWIEIHLLRIMYYIIVKRVHIHTLHTPLACYPVLTAGSVVFLFLPYNKRCYAPSLGNMSISLDIVFSFLSSLLFLLCGCVTSIFLFESVSACNASPHHSRFFIFPFFWGGWWRVTFLSFSFVVCLDTWSKERERERESSENANGIMDTLYCCVSLVSSTAAALSTVFLSAFFKWQMLPRPPIRIFFLLLFSILFIFCLFFGVCVCFFISGTAIHRTRDTKSECPLYFS